MENKLESVHHLHSTFSQLVQDSNLLLYLCAAQMPNSYDIVQHQQKNNEEMEQVVKHDNYLGLFYL